jgi:hypothetical protein
MLEALASVAFAALLGATGWGVKAVVKGMQEGVKFRTSLSMGLNTIATELSQFRVDVNKVMEEERVAHRAERDEYKETHKNFDTRISLTEQLLARHDERISQVEDHIRANRT